MTEIGPTRLPFEMLRPAIVATLLAAALWGCGLGTSSVSEIRELQENGEYARTIAPLRAMLDENPDQPEVNFLLGRALMRTGDSSSAIWPLRRSLDSSDHVVEASLMLARAELVSRTPRDVLQALEPVLALEPDNVEALTLRAQGYMKATRREDALADLERAIELDPGNLEALVPRVVVLIELERIDEAEQALIQANETIETTERKVREQLRGRLCAASALFAYEKGDVERSTTLHEECLASHPTNSIVVSQAVAHFDRLKQPERATEILQKAYEESDTPHFSNALARRMGRLGQPEERERLLREEAEQRQTPEAWFALADFYVLEERFDDACVAFEASLAADPDPGPMTLFAYVDTLIQAERFDDARREVQRVEPEHMQDLLEGRLLLATGDPEGALREFEAGLRLWPNNSAARFFAGQAAEQLGDFDRAIEEYREAIRKRGNTSETDAALYLARILVDRGTPREAYPSINRYLTSNPRSEDALLLMLKVGRETKNPKLIADSMTRLVRSGRPGLAMAYQIEMLTADSGPEVAIAAADASRLDLTNPDNAQALGALIEGLAALGRHDEAQERVAAGLKQHPDSAEFHELSARALMAAGGDPGKVRAGFERSLELQPERAGALIGLAELAAAAGANAEAIALYDRARASAPYDPHPARAAIALLQGPDQSEERERRLIEMVDLNPRDAYAANALAQSLATRGGDLDLALSYAERAAYFATVPEAKETLGWVHLLRGEHALAIEILQPFVDERPDAWTARYRLGLARSAQGDLVGARTEFDAVIEAGGPESEKARLEVARMTAPPTPE